ncbi:MAG TPA: hypothetical protein DHW14_09285 [Clostridiales bacterium]|nr:hypothetical protein [Clostridiales bacterium]
MVRLPRWAAVLCAVAVALTAWSPGLAVAKGGPPGTPPGLSEDGTPRGFALGRFRDVDEGHWAFRDIVMMRVKNVFGGYGDGRFGPQDPVTRIQLVCLALRIMGLEDEAEALDPETVGGILEEAFVDADTVPTWTGARECLAYAHHHGLLLGLCHDEQDRFRADDPATRLEVVVTLVEAMGLDDEAVAMSEAEIDAPDAETVPAWAHGHVALAMEMELLRGDETGALDLSGLVTRAQMAALLSRVDDREDNEVDRAVINGVLVSVTTGEDPSITIRTEARELEEYAEYEEELAEDEAAEGDQEPASEGHEEPASGGEQESSEEEGTEPSESESEGSEPEGSEAGGDDSGLVEETYPVTDDCLVFLRGRPAALEDLRPGDEVHLRLSDGEVVVIDARTEQVEVSGYFVEGLYSEDGTLVSVTIEVTEREQGTGEGPSPGTVETFPVAEDVAVWFRGDHDSDVRPRKGDRLELKLVHGEVVILVIDERCELSGEFEGLFVSWGPDAGTITFTVTDIEWEDGDPTDIDFTSAGQDLTLDLAKECVVLYRAGTISMDQLSDGDPIEVKVKDGLVVKVRLEDSESPEADDGDDAGEEEDEEEGAGGEG